MGIIMNRWQLLDNELARLHELLAQHGEITSEEFTKLYNELLKCVSSTPTVSMELADSEPGPGMDDVGDMTIRRYDELKEEVDAGMCTINGDTAPVTITAREAEFLLSKVRVA